MDVRIKANPNNQNPMPLTSLKDNLHIILSSVLFYTVIGVCHKPILSKLLPDMFRTLNPREIWQHKDRTLSSINCTIMVMGVVWCWNQAELSDDKLLGVSCMSQIVFSILAGYFIVDVFSYLKHQPKSIFLLHGITGLVFSILALMPLIQYFCIRLLTMEITTIFLNNNWFLDKSLKEYAKLRIANGICLLISYISIRIMYTYYIAYMEFSFIIANIDKMSIPIFGIACICTGIFLTLNTIWMLMILRKARNFF